MYCSDWATPIIQSAMKVDAHPILLEIIIFVSDCYEGSVMIDFDLKHGNVDVLNLAMANLNSTDSVVDEQRSLTMNVLAFGDITTTAPSISPTIVVASDANTAPVSITSGIGLILILMSILLFVVIIILLVVVLLKRGKSKKDFAETQQNIQVELGSTTEVHSSDVNSKDQMLETDDVMVVPGGNDSDNEVIGAIGKRGDSMYVDKGVDVAALSQQQVLNEIYNGNGSTAIGPALNTLEGP